MKLIDDEWNEINSPDHYNNNTIETIDLIRDSMKPQEFKGYLKGNVLKYVCRCQYKDKENPSKDLLKAEWYLKRLQQEMMYDGEK